MSTAKTRILFVGVSPEDQESLRVDKEARAIERAVRESKFRDQFVFEKQFAVRVSDLQTLLLDTEPEIVHFAGHGSGHGEFILEDELGNGNPVPIEALGQLIACAAPKVRCVVLNTCYSSTEIAALADSTRCAIGMTDVVEDKAAIAFAESFYRALGYGGTIREAMHQAVSALRLLGNGLGNSIPFIASKSDTDADFRFASAVADLPPSPSSGVTFTTTVTGGYVGQINNRSGG